MRGILSMCGSEKKTIWIKSIASHHSTDLLEKLEIKIC